MQFVVICFSKCDNIRLPDDFKEKSEEEKIKWLNASCINIVDTWIYEGRDDLLQHVRDILNNPEHPENYWIEDEIYGRFSCHFCEKTYLNIGSIQAHEKIKPIHIVLLEDKKKVQSSENEDKLFDYILLLFKLT